MLLSLALSVNAQKEDSVALLKKVTVTGYKRPELSSTAVPVQQLTKEELSLLNSVSVADAVKYFSGVVVKDYGGIGGLKTISVRSLGANHTGVMYDGIILGDAQGGQVDLGRFSLDNIESIQLFNIQPTHILLPARSFASAAVLSLNSAPANADKASWLSLKLNTGSFGYIAPVISYKGNIGNRFRHGFSTELQSADGAYSFIDYETGNEKVKRKNADIRSWRLEYDATFSVNDSNTLRFKIYYYHSKRGLPGSVVLYNPASDERLNNRVFFSQLSWKKQISSRSRVLISGKFSGDYKFYLDPSYPNNAGKLENEFHQREIYASAVYSYEIFPDLSASYAVDYFRSSLKRTDVFAGDFANPARDNFLNNLAVQFRKKRFEISGNLLHTFINEKVETGPTGKQLAEFTTGIAATLQPFIHLPFRVRASYKNIFRAPTFDDLYYTNVGNSNLQPEYAKQYNLGVTINSHPVNVIKEYTFTADAYYNKVKDKILAVPRQNLFQWTMLNIGTVDIKGLDVGTHLYFKQWKGLDISSYLSYTFQQAQDISDPSSTLYKTQLPYTPKHSGSASLNVGYKKLSCNYSVLLSSYRYRLGDLIPGNIVKEWATHDITFTYNLFLKKNRSCQFIAGLSNIFNTQYEIIKYYPMPRFNYRLGMNIIFNKNKS